MFDWPAVGLPHHIATLLYCFDETDRVLLMRRSREPNRGLFSPPGGKLKTHEGESPHACACREAGEELGLRLSPDDCRLAGIVSERAYEGQAHWLMFLFEVRPRLKSLPPPHEEGAFHFATKDELDALPTPSSDREHIWPLFWSHRGGYFAARCECLEDGSQQWTLEESRHDGSCVH